MGDEALTFEGGYQDTRTTRTRELLQAGMVWSGRWDLTDNQMENASLGFSLDHHRGQTRKRNLFLGLKYVHIWRPDRESVLHLGGSNGLRGYPANYLSGDSTLLFTAEQRLFTGMHPFNLFRVGLVAFVDTGKVSSGDNSNPDWLMNVGVGLRLLPDKTGRGQVIHMDLGFPVHNAPAESGGQFSFVVKRSL